MVRGERKQRLLYNETAEGMNCLAMTQIGHLALFLPPLPGSRPGPAVCVMDGLESATGHCCSSTPAAALAHTPADTTPPLRVHKCNEEEAERGTEAVT
ncbi:hypothetical protein O3P69_015034 [Scylla paramamosain]|uniref:Uncharacterized protein n=1 Tax=Scylla paramamosain TaxID=85552 RepID=A0AAW0T385_SCYPA